MENQLSQDFYHRMLRPSCIPRPGGTLIVQIRGIFPEERQGAGLGRVDDFWMSVLGWILHDIAIEDPWVGNTEVLSSCWLLIRNLDILSFNTVPTTQLRPLHVNIPLDATSRLGWYRLIFDYSRPQFAQDCREKLWRVDKSANATVYERQMWAAAPMGQDSPFFFSGWPANVTHI